MDGVEPWPGFVAPNVDITTETLSLVWPDGTVSAVYILVCLLRSSFRAVRHPRFCFCCLSGFSFVLDGYQEKDIAVAIGTGVCVPSLIVCIIQSEVEAKYTARTSQVFAVNI